jgi:hypothetical protein
MPYLQDENLSTLIIYLVEHSIITYSESAPFAALELRTSRIRAGVFGQSIHGFYDPLSVLHLDSSELLLCLAPNQDLVGHQPLRHLAFPDLFHSLLPRDHLIFSTLDGSYSFVKPSTIL